MNPANDATVELTPRAPLRRAAKWCVIVMAMLLGVSGMLLGAFTLVMARVPAYREQMQQWLSQRAHLDIEFSGAHAGWRGYGPELVFTNVTVRSVDKQRVLARAQRGGIGFDFWQALHSGRWASARIALEGTELKVQRRMDGEFEIVGQADWPEFTSDASFKLDALPVGQLTIRNLRLLFRDLQTGGGPWALDKVAVDVDRAEGNFRVDAQAELPASLGKRLAFTAQGSGELSDVPNLQWRTQLTATQLQLQGWAQLLATDWLAAAQGQGSFELKADLLGTQPQQVSGHFDFANVEINLPKWRTPLPQADALQVRSDDPDAAALPSATVSSVMADNELHYQTMGLAFNAAYRDHAWSANIERLQLGRADSAWPPSTAHLFAQFDASADAVNARRLTRLQATAQLLVLDNLWPLLAYLPDTSDNAKLRALNATGRVANLALNYQRAAADAPPSYGVRLQFAQLGLSPVGRAPGVSGLSGAISATGARGEVQLDSGNVAFTMPYLFRTPLPLDEVHGHVEWLRAPDGVQLHSNDFSIANSDGRAQAQFTLAVPQDGWPTIDMQAVGTELQATAAPRYMPAGIMQKRSLAWLDAAFPSGVVKHAEATLKGPLNKFPFRGNEGLFLIKAHIEGLTLDYQPGWLPATNLNVDAEFRNAGLNAVATAGRVNELTLQRVEGRIKDFRDSEIFIKAQTAGDLHNALSFVQQSPVGPSIGALFQQLSGDGDFHATADLYFPLKDFTRRKVDINVMLNQATVSMAGIKQSADQVDGSLRVLNDAVVAADLRGQFLQGEFNVTTEPVLRGRYNVVANGSVQAQPVAQFLKLPSWLKLDGATRYRFTMPGYPQRDADGSRHLYSVDSDLRGLALNLPAPVNKAAASSRSLHIDADLSGNDMWLHGSLGDLRSLVRLQQSNNEWHFDRGGLRADGIAAALPGQSGLRIDGHLENFVLDEWLKLGNASGATGAGNNAGTRVQDILRAANVSIGRFSVYGFAWPDVRGVLQATDSGWRVDVAGAQASGQVFVPYEFTSGRPLTLNMDSLWLSAAESSEHQAHNGSSFDPRDLPALRADIKHFHYGPHDFGYLQLTGNRSSDGLQVPSIQISGASFNGSGSGSWLQTAAGQQNSLAFTLESSDARATLQQFNYGDFIAAKRGKLLANLRWPGGLDENLLGRASGTLEVQLDEGQLLSVQPGAGRVLGLLSLAALPRRLGLDFHDVTDKGLAFDRIHADFTVQNGDAHTQDLLLRGPTAEIGVVGRMGLGARDYDQTAVVTGDVSAALPVAGTMAGGPVVGAALLLFSQIFKEPLKGVVRAYYHIGGSWDDPQVERIDSQAGKASLSGADPSIAP